MRLSHLAPIFLAALALFSLPAAHADNLVTNPNFGPDLGYPGYGTIAGWNQTSYTGALGYNPVDFWNNGTDIAPTVGFMQLNGSDGDYGSLSQLLFLTAGQTYTLSFDFNSRSPYNVPNWSTPDLTVTVGGATVFTAGDIDPADGPFYSASQQFVATSDEETLDFIGTNPRADWYSDATVLVTNVSLSSVSSTPEPSPLILLGTGILGIAGAGRRRLFARR